MSRISYKKTTYTNIHLEAEQKVRYKGFFDFNALKTQTEAKKIAQAA